MNNRRPRLIAPWIIAFGWLAAWPAHAALGGDAASVDADARGIGGTVSVTPMQAYDIREIACADGLRVREFLDRTGAVFAVAWNGPVMPILSQLLGTDYGAYVRAIDTLKRPGLHRELRVVLPDAVVELAGHLRAYSGRAYRPAAIPAGTAIADLR